MEMTVHAWVTENMPNIFGWALSRVGDRHEAEDLAGDIMAAMLACGDRAVGSRNAYLWRIAHNVYVSYLRKKRPTEALSETLIDDAPTAEEVLLETEQIRLLRRELSLLSEQYRTAAVLYYDARMSCTAIASRLGISVEMVKYYLFRARKLIREGMNMERILGEKSWNPQTFEIDFWGSRGGSMAEYSRFQKRKLPGNILLAAYYSRISAQELAMELGVALPYLEDELAILTERGYLTESGGKYLTNVPVFTTECTGRIKISEVPIKTVYDSKDNHQTHFDPFKDSIRIYRILGKKFIKYIFASLTSFVIDILLFTLFNYLFKDIIPEMYLIQFSTICARVISATYNYTVNYFLVFRSRAGKATSLVKYAALAFIQMQASAWSVAAVCFLLPMVSRTLIKCIIDTLLFLLSYSIQQRFVFASKKRLGE